MVYNGKSYWNGWFGGTIIFGNIHIAAWNCSYESQAPKNIWRDVAVILIIDLTTRTGIFHTWSWPLVGSTSNRSEIWNWNGRMDGNGRKNGLSYKDLSMFFSVLPGVCPFGWWWFGGCSMIKKNRKSNPSGKSCLMIIWFCSFVQHCPMNFATQPPCVCPVPERLKLRSRWRLRSLPLRSERATPKKWSVGFLSCELPNKWRKCD